MDGVAPEMVALAGVLIGALCGFAVRRARLCSFAALESALMAGDWLRMRVFAISLAVALIATQTLVIVGWFDPAHTTYLPARVAIGATLAGATLFGIGMSLVGTCAFGSLVRLGGGDLRSLVVIMTFGAVAYATLRGALVPLRIWAEAVATLPAPGGAPASVFDAVNALVGQNVRAVAAAFLVLALSIFIARDRRLRRMPRMIVAGVVLGLSVAGGFALTAVVDDFEAGRRIQSLTFVAPTARTLYAGLAHASSWIDFGVGAVVGTPVGAFFAARINAEARWEAFDDSYEMRRHLLGAVLMGVGGVLAGGCTIGQGLSAGALGALTWPLALTGMAIGARIGVAILVEGSLREAVAAGWARWRARGEL